MHIYSLLGSLPQTISTRPKTFRKFKKITFEKNIINQFRPSGGAKSQNLYLRCTLSNLKYFDIRKMEIESGVEAGLRSKGRGCFKTHFF